VILVQITSFDGPNFKSTTNFSLGDNLPVPNAQKNASDVLMRLIKITKDMSNESLIDFLPKG
jgi:hypothetical protein